MKRLSTLICCLLLLSMVMGELPTVFCLLLPEQAAQMVDPWWGNHSQPMYLAWYVKYLFNEIEDVTLLFVLAKSAYQYSFRLFLIAWIFFGYQVVDLLAFQWNYKTGYFIYWVMNISIMAGIVVLLRKEKQTAIVKSLQ